MKSACKPRRQLIFAQTKIGASFACSDMVPVIGVEPIRCRHHRILSYLLHTEYKRTQPPMEVVDGHQKARNY